MRFGIVLASVAAVAVVGQPVAVDPSVRLKSAVAAAKAGRTQAAIRQFREILAGSPPLEIEGQARLELVRIYDHSGQWWDAAEQLRALRKIAPNDSEYAYQLGLAYRNLSKQAFEMMRTGAPDSGRFHQMMGEQYAVAGEPEKAIAAFERAISADPKMPGSHLALAVIYIRAQKPDLARAEIEKELAIAPESAAARQVQAALTGGPP